MGKVEEIQRIANRFTLRRFWGRHVTKKCDASRCTRHPMVHVRNISHEGIVARLLVLGSRPFRACECMYSISGGLRPALVIMPFQGMGQSESFTNSGALFGILFSGHFRPKLKSLGRVLKGFEIVYTFGEQHIIVLINQYYSGTTGAIAFGFDEHG